MLKVRDNRKVVVGLHVLDPTRVQPLVSDDGTVFYRLSSDNLAGIDDEIVVPAREIIHDRMNCLFHPLVGTPPVFAQRLVLDARAQCADAHRRCCSRTRRRPAASSPRPAKSATCSRRGSRSNGRPGSRGSNFGRVAVLGGGLKYEKIAMTNVEGQMIENLKWSAEVVCSVYHVPPYKVGVGALPSYNNVQALNVEYYAQALQSHIEEIEELLDLRARHRLGRRHRHRIRHRRTCCAWIPSRRSPPSATRSAPA